MRRGHAIRPGNEVFIINMCTQSNHKHCTKADGRLSRAAVIYFTFMSPIVFTTSIKNKPTASVKRSSMTGNA